MSRSRRVRGFTVLEMLLAIALLMALLGVSARLLGDLGDAKIRTEETLRVVGGTSRFFDLLQARLDTATATDGEGRPGVFGDETSISVSGSRVLATRLVESASGHPLQDRAVFEARIQEGVLEVREDGGSWSPIVSDLVAIRFRYHDGNEWLGEWDGDRGLPRGVEVQVWTSPWPPGMTPAWGPSSDDAFIEDQRDVLFDETDLRSFEETAVDPGEAPAPDRVRVLSILDAAPSDGGEQ